MYNCGKVLLYLCKSYREIRAACRQHDFMRVHASSLGGQGTIHQRTTLQQAVEHRNQRVLMIVPSQTELLLLLLHNVRPSVSSDLLLSTDPKIDKPTLITNDCIYVLMLLARSEGHTVRLLLFAFSH